MALQSALFRGDAKLEAAATSDAAHITPGARGPHVGKIQQALIQLDGATIVADMVYGPGTAAAVLAYKQSRSIINRSYQSQADNIVGKMTIATLDRELVEREVPPFEDGMAVCKFTDGRGYRSGGLLLAFSAPSPAPAPPSPLPPGPPPPSARTPRQHAIDVLAIAKSWVNSALEWLRRVRGFYQQHGNTNWPSDANALFDAVDVHFHLRGLPNVTDQPPHLDKIIQNYVNILAILSNTNLLGDDPTLYTDESDPRFGAYATAKIGGFSDSSVSKKIWFHGLFLTVPGQKARCAMIIHEGGHSAATALHYAYGHPKSSGGVAGEPHRGVTHPRNYANLTPDEALHNADTYATFAAHASTGNPGTAGDIRPGAHALAI